MIYSQLLYERPGPETPRVSLFPGQCQKDLFPFLRDTVTRVGPVTGLVTRDSAPGRPGRRPGLALRSLCARPGRPGIAVGGPAQPGA
jgi:hypothetical protein